MTDLEKDQAIYQAMLEIADAVFERTMENNDSLKELIKQYGGFITLSDLCNYKHEFTKLFGMVMRDSSIYDEIQNVDVDTFSCSFPSCQVFDLLKYWKSLARIKGEQVFIYEEKIKNEFVGSVEVTIDNSNNAKLLVKHCAKDQFRPVLNCVLAEINANTQSIDFVGCDGHTLSVISNNPAQIFVKPEPTHTIFQAMFLPDDWKRICDYAKKNKHLVKFDIYRKQDREFFDTFLVHLGDVKLRSTSHLNHRYPNWKSVIPSPDKLKHRFNIVQEEWKAAQDWIRGLKGEAHRHVNVSFYRGSDLVYFDYDDYDFSKSMTATFHLTRTSHTTIGVAYSLRKMLRIKFTGFNLEDSEHGTIVNCEESDLMLLLPMICPGGYVRDVEHREVVTVEQITEAA